MNLWNLLTTEGKKYLQDAMPGGALNPEVSTQGLMDAVALGTAPVPIVGDIAGLAADAKRMYDNPEERTMGNAALAGLGLLPFVPAMTVFHGTPHLFNKFDSSKIGTGEGAQAYGHGLYFAENRGVAEDYARQLASKAYSKLEKVDRNNYRVTAPDGTVITEGVPLGPATRAKGAFDAKAGNLMQVDLPDEQIAKMLDWDKPMNEKEMISLYESLDKVDPRFAMQLQDSWYRMNESTGKGLDGQDVYMALMNNLKTPQSVAQTLKEAGIPGIRYLDQNSRAVPNITNKRLADLYAKHGGNADAAVDEMMRSVYNTPKKKEAMREQFMKQLQVVPKKTSNFVVFPGMEDMLRIEQINNQPIESLFRSLGR